MNAVERAIRQTNAAGRAALAPFLTAGYPEPDSFLSMLERVAGETELVEIGVPFTDPLADGVTIQRSSSAALEAGVDLTWILATLRRARCDTPFVLMSYLNPLLAFGFERLVVEAEAANVAGLIVPDLPLEESAPLRRILDGGGPALIQLVTPATPPARLARICEASRGFVYAVTMTGTTGGAASDVGDYLERVRGLASVPVLAGFGVRTAEQVRSIAEHADGAIVGSALIEIIERGGDPVAFLRRLRDGASRASEEVRK